MQNAFRTAMMLAALFAIVPALRADDFDTVRANWVAMQVGANNDMSNADIVSSVNATASSANWALNNMNQLATRTYLWSDISDFTNSATITSNFTRLATMAQAYAQPGNSLQGSTALAQAIIGGLDWMYSNHYNENVTSFGNWWDWQIGSAQALNNAALLLYSRLTPAEIANYANATGHFTPDTAVGAGSTLTGANLLDEDLVVLLRATLSKNFSSCWYARNGVGPVFSYVTSGDGFYVDGSFLQHNSVAYTGTYGEIVLADLANLYLLLNGTSWALVGSNQDNVWNWVFQSFAPVMYRGAMMDMQSGRAISRYGHNDHSNGRTVSAALARLAQTAPSPQQEQIKSLVKGYATSDTYFGDYYTGLPPYDIVKLQAIVNDSSIVAAPSSAAHYNFASMARAVHTGDGYAFGLSMYSKDIQAYESLNGENLKGWYTGLGMTYLYDPDLTQYANNYWPTVNPLRLAGVTSDGTTGSASISFNSAIPTNWVGGSTVNGVYGSAGMAFNLQPYTGSTLNGQKSWFFFANKMVALGARVTSSSANLVETIVDNRRIDVAGDNALVVNGTVEPTTIGWSSNLSNVSWAYLDGNVANSGVGYYFPATASLYALRETRSGTWQSINSLNGSATSYTNNFLSLAFEHGTKPTNATYAYVVLPNQTAASMAAYAANPDISILENSSAAQAVLDVSANAIGANFWSTSSHTIFDQNGQAFLTTAQQASVTTVQNGNELDVAVSDPTKANTGTITLNIGRSAGSVISNDPQVSVTQLSPTIQIQVNTNGSAGKSFSAKFNLVAQTPTTTTLTSSLNPSALNQSVIFTAQVQAGSDTPTGTVTFYNNGAQIGNPVILNSGTATFATSLPTSGSISMVAVYSGDSTFAMSTSAVLRQVVSSPQTMTLTLTDVADAEVRLQSPSLNWGASIVLDVMNATSNTILSYLKFDVSSVPPSMTITGATVSLILDGAPSTASTHTAYSVANTTWGEGVGNAQENPPSGIGSDGITYNNRPTIGSTVLGSWTVPASAAHNTLFSFGGGSTNALTAAVQAAHSNGNNLFSMALVASSGNGDVYYYSKDVGIVSARPIIAITAVSNVTQLVFGSPPAASVTTGGNAGSAITVIEENSSDATVTNAMDTITLTVDGPNGYIQTYTAATENGVAIFDLSGVPLATAGSYIYTASSAPLSSSVYTETVSN